MALELQTEKTPTFTAPSRAASPVVYTPRPEVAPTVPAYRGDVTVFLVWMGCFVLIGSMIVYETVVGLLFHK